MWTPRLSSKKKAYLTDRPFESGSDSSSEVSSSTSSSSSDVSSDDEAKIGEVRDNCFTPPEIAQLLLAPKPYPKHILVVRAVNRIIM